MQVEVTILCATDLKNVNWRHGNLKPYAVLWIDSGPKCTTKVDVDRDENPFWDEKMFIALPPTSHPDTAVLYIDIVHANAPPGTKPLVGSAQLPLRDILNEARSKGKVPRILKVKRPSGRPHGKLDIRIGVKDQMASRQTAPYGQPAYYGAPPPQRPAYQYPYNAPATRPAGYPTTYAYGAPPPVQAYGGGYATAAPVKGTKDKHKHDMETGLAVGAVAGLVGGLVIAEGLEASSSQTQAPTVVENVTVINETNVYDTTNVYDSTNVYESTNVYDTTNVYDSTNVYESNDVYYSSTDVYETTDVTESTEIYDDGGW